MALVLNSYRLEAPCHATEPWRTKPDVSSLYGGLSAPQALDIFTTCSGIQRIKMPPLVACQAVAYFSSCSVRVF
jgi:hypothetical protein